MANALSKSANRKGAVVISVDVEGWAGIQRQWPERRVRELQEHYRQVRPHEILFDIFDSRKIPVTWALVSEVFSQNQSCRDLVGCIARSDTPHEIASHALQHRDISEFGGPEEFAAQLADIRQFEIKNNLTPAVSYIFPRNRTGFSDQLRNCGFRIYRRGTMGGSYRLGGGWVAKAARWCEYVLCFTPPVNDVCRDANDMLVTEGSMTIVGAGEQGCRFIPFKCREIRVLKGVERAIAAKRILHLWFHDYVLFRRPAPMAEVLEAIAEHLDRQRRAGLIDICTMGELARRPASAESAIVK